MTKHQLGEQEVQIARYQLLSQEVTDPFAACLLRVIVEELEADLRMHDAHCGVPNQRPAETLALISSIDRQLGEHNNGDWVRHVAPEATRSRSDIYGAGHAFGMNPSVRA